MNRDIEFRGKHADEWIYGYIIEEKNKDKSKYYITKHCEIGSWYYVKTETIGQYTGLKDKNGKKIFEGDIIRLDDDYRKLISSANAKTEEDLVRKDCLVGFKEGSFMFCRSKYFIDEFDSYLWLTEKHCEVIGNIYENKELVEV